MQLTTTGIILVPRVCRYVPVFIILNLTLFQRKFVSKSPEAFLLLRAK